MLGARIAALRRSRGMSQSQLAQELGVSPSAIGMYEQGRREPSAATVVALSNLFQVSTDYLLTGKAPDSGRQRLLYDSLEPLASSPLLCSYYNHELLSGIDRALSPSIEGRYRSVAEWMSDLRAK